MIKTTFYCYQQQINFCVGPLHVQPSLRPVVLQQGGQLNLQVHPTVWLQEAHQQGGAQERGHTGCKQDLLWVGGKIIQYSQTSLINVENTNRLAGCGLLHSPINPLACQSVDWPRSAWPIEKYTNPPPPPKGFCCKSWAIWGKFGFLRFSKILPPLGGSTPKRYFRDHGVVHAKFGWNPSSSLGSKQTNKQRASSIYIKQSVCLSVCLCVCMSAMHA